jgi:hypothetical protein
MKKEIPLESDISINILFITELLIIKIIFEAIPERSFSDWSMGYSSISKKELNSINGMNDFFKGGTCLADIDSGRAKKLLKAFLGGRWRLN